MTTVSPSQHLSLVSFYAFVYRFTDLGFQSTKDVEERKEVDVSVRRSIVTTVLFLQVARLQSATILEKLFYLAFYARAFNVAA